MTELNLLNAVYGDMPNYATLRFCDSKEKRILVQMSFRVCDDGYAGCCVAFQQSLVDAYLADAFANDRTQKYLRDIIRHSHQSYGGRGSHPAGPYGESIRDRFVSVVEHIIAPIAEGLVTFLRQSVEVTLQTTGVHPLAKRWEYAWEPRVTLMKTA